MYVARLVKPLGVKATRLAYGLPVGSNLEYADEVDVYKRQEDICVVQFDAHLDWTDAYGEFCYSHSSPMRRASEMAHVSKMMQIEMCIRDRDTDESNAAGCPNAGEIIL